MVKSGQGRRLLLGRAILDDAGDLGEHRVRYWVLEVKKEVEEAILRCFGEETYVLEKNVNL